MSAYALYSDPELLNLLVLDDKQAFETLYRRYWSVLYDAACRRLKNSQQAEDIVQEIFVKLWCRRSELKVENLEAYLHTAVSYRVLNHVQRNTAAEIFYEPFEEIAASVFTADSRVMEKELAALAETYISTLPEKRREIFMLYFTENLSTKEIARRLCISRKTVQNQLGTAIQGLRTQLISSMLILFLFSV